MKKIPISKGKFVLVDDEDFEWLSQENWLCGGDGNYAVRQVAMHREIMKAPKGMVIDHIDGNGLNNQKSNLRICTQQQNNWNIIRKRRSNTSGYIGVYLDNREHSKASPWKASVGLNGKQVILGSFKTKHHAALVRDLWAIEFHGEYATTNFNIVAHG